MIDNPVYYQSGLRNSSAISQAGKGYFPDPWCDYASTEMPKTLSSVFKWCEFIWMSNGTFRMACERVVRYFITKVELKDVSHEEEEKYIEYLEGELDITNKLAKLGDDMMCYGNALASLYVPFRRHLICNRCGIEQPISRCNFTFNSKFEFISTCTHCDYRGVFKRVDRRADDLKLKVIRWSPHDIIVQFNPVSHDVEYRWKVDRHLSDQIKKGNPFYLRTTPWEIVEAIKSDGFLRFNDDSIFHMKEETLAGLPNVGWGIPRLISNFKQAYYIQILKRFNEALAMDYIVPVRVLAPKASSAVPDPVTSSNLALHKQQVLSMVAQHRKDPATWHYLPFPVDYTTLSGEAKALAPNELIVAATDEMLNAQGIPAEMYKGTLQVQAMPTALRMFQQTWPQLIASYNGFLNWIIRQLVRIKSWEPAKAGIQLPTLADDVEKKQILLQMAAGNQISKNTAYTPLGIDVKEEIRKIMEEQRYEEEQNREAQREAEKQRELDETVTSMEQQQIQQNMMGGGMQAPGGAMPQGGGGGGGEAGGQPMPMPPMSPADMVEQAGQPGGPNKATTPQEMMAQAEQIAGMLLQMPYEQRRSELTRIKKSNEPLHALITSKMQSIRNQAQTIGGYQMLQSGALP